MAPSMGASASQPTLPTHVQRNRLTPRSARMLKKAEHLTKQVDYQQEEAVDLLVPAAVTDDMAKADRGGRQITGIRDPRWANDAGSGSLGAHLAATIPNEVLIAPAASAATAEKSEPETAMA